MPTLNGGLYFEYGLLKDLRKLSKLGISEFLKFLYFYLISFNKFYGIVFEGVAGVANTYKNHMEALLYVITTVAVWKFFFCKHQQVW